MSWSKKTAISVEIRVNSEILSTKLRFNLYYRFVFPLERQRHFHVERWPYDRVEHWLRPGRTKSHQNEIFRSIRSKNAFVLMGFRSDGPSPEHYTGIRPEISHWSLRICSFGLLFLLLFFVQRCRSSYLDVRCHATGYGRTIKLCEMPSQVFELSCYLHWNTDIIKDIIIIKQRHYHFNVWFI